MLEQWLYVSAIVTAVLIALFGLFLVPMFLIDRYLKRFYGVPAKDGVGHSFPVIVRSGAVEKDVSVDRIRLLCHHEPFMPFFVVTNRGERHLVENGDAIAISSGRVHLFSAHDDVGVHMDLSEIAGLETFGV